MRYRGSLVKFWLLAMLLLDLAAFAAMAVAPGNQRHWPNMYVIGLFALIFSQTGLMAVWIAMGRTFLPWRILGGFLWIVTWCMLMELLGAGPDTSYSLAWCSYLVAQLVIVLVILGINSFAGWRIQVSDKSEMPLPEQKPPFQFTLWDIFVWMTVLAIILGLIESLQFMRIMPSSKGMWISLLIGLFNSSLTLSTLWAVNGQKYPVFRAVQLFIVFGIIMSTLLISGAIRKPSVFMMFTQELLLLIGSFYVFRLEGFRLVRRNSIIQPSP
jgi:hypothetical protein